MATKRVFTLVEKEKHCADFRKRGGYEKRITVQDYASSVGISQATLRGWFWPALKAQYANNKKEARKKKEKRVTRVGAEERADLLSKWRDSGLSVKDFAKTTGISHVSIYAYVNQEKKLLLKNKLQNKSEKNDQQLGASINKDLISRMHFLEEILKSKLMEIEFMKMNCRGNCIK